MLQQKVNELNDIVKSLNSIEALQLIAKEYNTKTVFTTSFG